MRRCNWYPRVKKALRVYGEMRAMAPEQPGTYTLERAMGAAIKKAFEDGYRAGHDDGFDEGVSK